MKLNLIFSQNHITKQPSFVQDINNINNNNKKPDNCTYSLKIARLTEEKQNPHPLFASTSKSNPIFKVTSKVVDLRSKLPPAYNQGNIGSCTANALCAAYQFLDNSMGIPSRLFVYYNGRDQIETTDEDTNVDSGSYLSDGIECLVKNGVCAEASWPYIESNFSIKPSPECYTEALSHQLLNANTIPNNMNAMKRVLLSGLPFVTGISIYSSFESQSVTRSGLVPMPDITNEINLGGHAVLVCGYNDNIQWYQNRTITAKNGAKTIKQITSFKQKGVWIVRNSWGVDWGAKGYFYLPYPYLLDSNMASDQWVIDSIEMPVLKPVPVPAPISKTSLSMTVPHRRPAALFANRFLADNLVGGGCSCGH